MMWAGPTCLSVWESSQVNERRHRNAEHDHYLWQGGSRSQVDIILSGELSHYWTWYTYIHTHTGQFDTEWTHPQRLNEARESSRYSQESISLDRTCTDTLCLFGASTVSRSCRDTDGRVDAQRVAGNIVANGIINTTEIWSSIRYLNGHI